MGRCPYGKGLEVLRELVSQQTDDCVLWPYATASGYGVTRRAGKQEGTHRISCEWAHGDPPLPQMEVAHSCHTPACVNPRHLRWATVSENQLDRVTDETDQRGVRHWNSRLTPFDVQAIRHYVSCGTKQRVLAKHYGVSVQHLSEIVNKQAWSWL